MKRKRKTRTPRQRRAATKLKKTLLKKKASKRAKKQRAKNAGIGRQFAFHGAFVEKKDAVAKEQATPGAFIKTVWYRAGPRYAVLTRRENPARRQPKKAKRRRNAAVGDVITVGRKRYQVHIVQSADEGTGTAREMKKAGIVRRYWTIPPKGRAMVLINEYAGGRLGTPHRVNPDVTRRSPERLVRSNLRRKKRNGIVEQIRHGDRVTIVNRFGQQSTGRAVMRSSSGGWVLNMGGPHGTPGIASEENIVKVKAAKRNTRAKRRRRGNPDTADQLYTRFHGKGPSRVKDVDVSTTDLYEDLPTLAQLGKLVSLVVGEGTKLSGSDGNTAEAIADGEKSWIREISFDEREAPDVAATPNGRQIHLVGGNQTLTDEALRNLGADPSKDTLDLGYLYRIEYFTRKKFDGFQPVTYWHLLGEESGISPRLMYDRRSKRLYLAGGEYVVKPEGIVN